MVFILMGVIITPVWAATFGGPSVAYYSTAGLGAIYFDDTFTATAVSWSGGYIMFSNFNDGEPLSTVGFQNPNAGTSMTFNSFNHTDIIFTVVGGAGLIYRMYLPTIPSLQVVTAGVVWDWDNGAHILTVTQGAGTTRIYLIWGGEAPGGGAIPPTEEPPPEEPPTEPPTDGIELPTIPEWVPDPLIPIIIRIYPWWQRYGSAVIVGSIVAVFALSATQPRKKRRGGGLDVILNPEKTRRKRRTI